METKFYVYVLLDTLKNGKFNYGDYSFDNEPFYVGKGHGNRCTEHFYKSKLDKNLFKNNKIKKLLELGIKPLILKISNNIFEIDAFELEKKLIKIIGRRDLKLGPLTNLTDGGEGIVGLIRTKEHRQKLGLSNKGRKLSEEAKKKISDSLIGKIGRNTGNKHTEKTKKQISETKKGTLSWNATPVLQLTKDNILIKEWVSSTNAAKKLNLSQGNICSVINGKRKSCGGFKWKLKKL